MNTTVTSNETKESYVDKMGTQLKEWATRLDVVKAKVASATAEARVDYDKQLADWHSKEAVFKQKFEEIKTAASDKFESLKTGAQSAWDDVNVVVTKFADKQ